MHVFAHVLFNTWCLVDLYVEYRSFSMASLSTDLPFMCCYPCVLECMYHRVSSFADFPPLYKMAFGMQQLACALQRFHPRASRLVELPKYAQ